MLFFTRDHAYLCILMRSCFTLRISSLGQSSRISHVCIEIYDFSGGISFYFQGDDQLIERLAGLDGIITESGNNLKEESGKNRVRVLAEVSL